MLNPVHLRTLREVVRTGSFAEAGRTLGHTASAVSQQMAQLERAVGAELFERTARSARRTPLAERLAQRSRDALAALEALEREVRGVVAGERGGLRLASFATANARVLPDALAELVRARPDAEVQLDEGEPEEVVGDVVDGIVDAAVVFEYDLDPREWPPQLCAEEVLAEPLVVALPPNHPGPAEIRPAEIGLAELAEHPWICTRPDTSGARSLVRWAATAGFTPRIEFRSDDYGVIRDLVARGLGVAVLPALAVDRDAVRAARPSGWQPNRRVKILYRGQNTNPLLPLALQCLRSSCAELAQSWCGGPTRAEGA